MGPVGHSIVEVVPGVGGMPIVGDGKGETLECLGIEKGCIHQQEAENDR